MPKQVLFQAVKKNTPADMLVIGTWFDDGTYTESRTRRTTTYSGGMSWFGYGMTELQEFRGCPRWDEATYFAKTPNTINK